MSRTAFLLFVASNICLVGCQPAESPAETYSVATYSPASAIPFSEIDNVYVAELQKQPNTYVFAINRDSSDQGRGAYWGTLNKYGWIRIYESGPKVSLYQVAHIAISENDRYLAVETTGEGHPILDIFELEKWLKYAPRGKDRDTPPLEPIASLNPYPFGFSVKEWKGNAIVLLSRGRLDELRERRREGRADFSDEELTSEDVNVFLWDVENDRIRSE